MSFRKFFSVLLAAVLLAASFSGCSKEPETITLTLFAPDDSLAVVLTAAEKYKSAAPNVELKVTLKPVDTLAAMIEAGASCDVFIADVPAYMDYLDKEGDPAYNTNGNDRIYSETRVELYEGAIEEDLVETFGETAVYSAAVTKATVNKDAAAAFVTFLTGDVCRAVYEENGCTPVSAK